VSFFVRYPYLTFSLVLAAQATAALVLAPRSRNRALLSGLLSAPSSLLSFAFVPEYWSPSRVFSFVVGPEDILFSFSTGVLVWFVAERLGARREGFEPLSPSSVGPVVRRHIVWPCLFLAIFLPGWAAGARPMDATLAAAAVFVPLLAAWAPGAWRLALAGGAGFAALYGFCCAAAFYIWPHLGGQWSHAALWGLRVGPIPVEELAWAFAFGAVWPWTLAHAFEADGRLASGSRLRATRAPARPLTAR